MQRNHRYGGLTENDAHVNPALFKGQLYQLAMKRDGVLLYPTALKNLKSFMVRKYGMEIRQS